MNSLLETKNLHVLINHKMVCQKLNLQINPGDTLGILGANGSGKTTLLHTLAKLHPVSDGNIFLQNQDLALLSEKEIAKKIGVLFQDTHYTFSQSVLEVCLTGRNPHLAAFSWESSEDAAIALAALAIMQLENKTSSPCDELSGGEQRRLAIATLLTQAPAIYLLDEPLNHLDIYHQIKMVNHFKKLTTTNNSAIVMTLHDVNIAQHFCNKILLLFNDGNTIQGHPYEVLCAENLERLYGHPIKALSCGEGLYWLPEFNVL